MILEFLNPDLILLVLVQFWESGFDAAPKPPRSAGGGSCTYLPQVLTLFFGGQKPNPIFRLLSLIGNPLGQSLPMRGSRRQSPLVGSLGGLGSLG